MKAENWIERAKSLFERPKPPQFCNADHCDECFEHNETLSSNTIDTIGMNELGNPGYDPICFCNIPGRNYYFPALIRLSLETAEDDFYFSQLLFHLEYDGKNNDWVSYCNGEQRDFIAQFIEYMITTYPKQLDDCLCTDNAFKALEIWKT